MLRGLGKLLEGKKAEILKTFEASNGGKLRLEKEFMKFASCAEHKVGCVYTDTLAWLSYKTRVSVHM